MSFSVHLRKSPGRTKPSLITAVAEPAVRPQRLMRAFCMVEESVRESRIRCYLILKRKVFSLNKKVRSAPNIVSEWKRRKSVRNPSYNGRMRFSILAVSRAKTRVVVVFAPIGIHRRYRGMIAFVRPSCSMSLHGQVHIGDRCETR
jgi:hypothetical protein